VNAYEVQLTSAGHINGYLSDTHLVFLNTTKKLPAEFNVLSIIDEMGMWMPRFLRYFWIFSWSILTPVLVLTVIISSLIDRRPDHTEGAYRGEGPKNIR
jgi:hypothetical protein